MQEFVLHFLLVTALVHGSHSCRSGRNRNQMEDLVDNGNSCPYHPTPVELSTFYADLFCNSFF